MDGGAWSFVPSLVLAWRNPMLGATVRHRSNSADPHGKSDSKVPIKAKSFALYAHAIFISRCNIQFQEVNFEDEYVA